MDLRSLRKNNLLQTHVFSTFGTFSTYLEGFVEPSVPAVQATASAVQHLSGHPASVDVLRHPWHRCIKADNANALLNATHRLLVGLIWQKNEQQIRGVEKLSF